MLLYRLKVLAGSSRPDLVKEFVVQTIILTLHVIVCVVLIILVLLQSGREGMGVIFGGSGNSSVFGSTGAGGVLVKLTTFLAVLFIATSLGYNLMTRPMNDQGSSIIDIQFEEIPAPAAETPAETTPAAAPATAADTTAATPAPAAATETPAATAATEAAPATETPAAVPPEAAQQPSAQDTAASEQGSAS